MRRHSILIRLSPADNAPVEIVQKDSLVSEIRFVDGYRNISFDIGWMVRQLIARGIVPTEAGADLAILAASVFAADTRISRSDDAQDGWTREIDLYLPVADRPRWESLTSLLERILRFLTGDHWRILLRSRPTNHPSLVTTPKARVRADATSICLLSGGLDSFIGAVDLLADGAKPLFVSHYGDKATSAQDQLSVYLSKVFGPIAPRHVRANVRFDKNDFAHAMAHEPSTRGRSFLFFGLAALAASGFASSPTIYVPENGLISLNVPLDPLRVGAASTRTTHPFYMARWQQLLDGLGIKARLENPYRFKTKGEMLRESRDQKLVREHAADTISCSSVTKSRWLGSELRQCGSCVPCLIRRAAVIAAFGKDPTPYTLSDLKGQPLDPARAEGEHVRSFQMMARRLERRPGLARILVHKAGPLSDYTQQEVADYADVFSRGIAEVDRITKPVKVRPE